MNTKTTNTEPLFKAVFDAASIGMALTTPDGRVQYANQALQRMTGNNEEAFFAAPSFLFFIHPEERERIADIAARGNKGEQLEPFYETRLLHANGIGVDVEISIAPLPCDDQARSVVTLHDIRYRKRIEHALQISQDGLEEEVRRRTKMLQKALKRLSSHVENSPLAVVEWDSEMRVRKWSPVAVELFGWRAEDVIGLQPNDWRFVHEDDRVEVDIVIDHLKAGSRNISVNRNYCRDGRVLHCEWYNSVLFDDDGRLDSVLSLVHDVSERHASEIVLRDREEQFRTTFEQAAVGMSHVGLDGKWLRFNHQLCEITGYPAEELERLTFQDITHPDDLAGDVALVEQVQKGQIDSYQLEKRYFRKDGSITWVRITVSVRRDETGAPLYFIVPIEDINDRKHAEIERQTLLSELELRVSERTAELRASEHRLQAITNNLPALVAYIDRELKYQFANEAYRKWFGTDPASFIGTSFLEPHASDAVQFEQYLQQVLAGEEVSFEYYDTRLDVGRWMRVFWIPDQVEGGTVAGFYSMKFDISDYKRLEQSLSERALSDALTGLPNRPALIQQLDNARARFVRDQRTFAVLFIDLDGFKAVNDQLGHDAGDEVLCLIAQRLTNSVRKSDTVARIGGDEFVVLLDGLSDMDTQAEIVASKLNNAVGEPILVAGKPVLLGASIGVLVCTVSDVPAQALLKEADKLMYQAKSAGRNCYRFGHLSALVESGG